MKFKLEFKSWLEGTGLARAPAEPDQAFLTPLALARRDAVSGVGGFPRFDLEPLPRNKKPMKKKSKK